MTDGLRRSLLSLGLWLKAERRRICIESLAIANCTSTDSIQELMLGGDPRECLNRLAWEVSRNVTPMRADEVVGPVWEAMRKSLEQKALCESELREIGKRRAKQILNEGRYGPSSLDRMMEQSHWQPLA